MTFKSFQRNALRTANSTPAAGNRRLVGALGLCGEAGEVAEIVKKSEGHGHPIEIERLTEELGDVLWSVANVATLYGLQLDDIASLNLQKLQSRYPDGFSPQRSMHRSGPKNED